jgi:hypothetical protein
MTAQLNQGCFTLQSHKRPISSAKYGGECTLPVSDLDVETNENNGRLVREKNNKRN